MTKQNNSTNPNNIKMRHRQAIFNAVIGAAAILSGTCKASVQYLVLQEGLIQVKTGGF